MDKSVEVKQENTVIFSLSAVLAGLFIYGFKKVVGKSAVLFIPFFGLLACLIVYLKDKPKPVNNNSFTGLTGNNNLGLVSVIDAVLAEKERNSSVFLSGKGLPLDSVGQNGDSYVDTLTGNWYEKQNNTWF